MLTDDPQSAAALCRIIDEEKAALTSKRDEIVCAMFAAKFRECVSGQTKSVRQLRVALWNLSPQPAQRLLFP